MEAVEEAVEVLVVMVALSSSASSSSTQELMPFPPRRLASSGSRNRGKREVSRKHGLRRKASQRGGPRWWC